MAVGVETLNPTQLLRKLALLLLIVAVFAGLSVVATPPDWAVAHEIVVAVGKILLVVCILGRCWCTLYIGGRKGAELVDIGPYSLVRNPLYVFSFFGAVGMGAQTGSMVISALCFLITWAVFRIVVGKEEAYLTQALGAPYVDYMARTPRFLPNFRRWKGADVLEVRPNRVALTFFDGLAFVLAIPLAMGLQWLQQQGHMPVLLHLP